MTRTSIVRWDPFREMNEFRNTVDRFFDRGTIRPLRLVSWEHGGGLFPVDLYETEDEVVVNASLPGVKAEDVEISATAEHLTIKAEAREDTTETQPNYHRQERRYGAFQRTLPLPVKVDTDKGAATFENGVLKLTLPKVAEVKAKTIPVKTAKAVEAKAAS
jgi:HSP20 family protein